MASQKKITVVNDYPEFLDLLVDFLTGEGYDVSAIPKHQNAFEQVKQSRPDVLICDIVMDNEPHGFALIDMLYLDPETRKIPVIICSAATQYMQQVHASFAARGIRWLEKPFEIERLLSLISEVLTSSE